MRVIVISGSRSFEGLAAHGRVVPLDADKKAQAVEFLSSHLFRWIDEDKEAKCVVLSGEAKGPDSWCLSFVEKRGISAKMSARPARIFHRQVRCDGMIVDSPTGDVERWSPNRVHPLVRDEELARRARAYADAGHHVSYLAIVDTRSPTGGTRATVSHLQMEGIQGILKEF